MAKTDWAQLNAEFLQEHEATGISAKDWCDSRGLNYNSARRYLKSRGQSPVQPDKSRVAAQSAHSEVRKTAQSAQSAQSAQAKGNEAKAKGGERRGEKSSSSTQSQPEPEQTSKNKGRDGAGRFVRGEYEGNPNPPATSSPAAAETSTEPDDDSPSSRINAILESPDFARDIRRRRIPPPWVLKEPAPLVD